MSRLLKGELLDDALEENGLGPSFWRNKINLREYSETVRGSLTN